MNEFNHHRDPRKCPNKHMHLKIINQRFGGRCKFCSLKQFIDSVFIECLTDPEPIFQLHQIFEEEQKK